jgi:hypothetical protein
MTTVAKQMELHPDPFDISNGSPAWGHPTLDTIPQAAAAAISRYGLSTIPNNIKKAQGMWPNGR